MGLSLIAFDTDHIKQYVFGTDKLREIRGASSILDYLNRFGMTDLAEDPSYHAQRCLQMVAEGFFSLDLDKAHEFGEAVQRMYHIGTGDAASITYVVQALPNKYKDTGGC